MILVRCVNVVIALGHVAYVVRGGRGPDGACFGVASLVITNAVVSRRQVSVVLPRSLSRACGSGDRGVPGGVVRGCRPAVIRSRHASKQVVAKWAR